MKYLYPYEKEKENLSTQEQLNTAIETNRRESRRGNYTAYANDNLVGRSQHNSLPPNALPLPIGPLAIGQMDGIHRSQSPYVNGQPQQQHHPHNSQHIPLNLGQSAGSGQPSFSPPPSHSPLVSVNSPEPQREALDLANSTHRSDPVSSPNASRSPLVNMSGNTKRNSQEAFSPPTSSLKRLCVDDLPERNMRIAQMVTLREDGRKELSISVDIDGVLYEGVLQAKNDDASSTSSNSNNVKRS
ncbi:protein dead ringer [Lasius niger]|uniref:Protein dead ringer n=1 Tax=Lasius niger TaxID=67767 RepID=A0A0J7KN40_LASNI|nr:protein dead ringer [Lasius niger]